MSKSFVPFSVLTLVLFLGAVFGCSGEPATPPHNSAEQSSTVPASSHSDSPVVDKNGPALYSVAYYAKVHNEEVLYVTGLYQNIKEPFDRVKADVRAIAEYIYDKYPDMPVECSLDSGLTSFTEEIFPTYESVASMMEVPGYAKAKCYETINDQVAKGKIQTGMLPYLYEAADMLFDMPSGQATYWDAKGAMDDLAEYTDLNGSDYEKQMVGVLIGSFELNTTPTKRPDLWDAGVIAMDWRVGKWFGAGWGAVASIVAILYIQEEVWCDCTGGPMWEGFDPSFP